MSQSIGAPEGKNPANADTNRFRELHCGKTLNQTNPSHTGPPAPSADALPVHQLQSGFPQRLPNGLHHSAPKRSMAKLPTGNQREFKPQPTATAIWAKTSDDACILVGLRD